MDSLKLKEERATIVQTMEAILDGAKSEDRDLSGEEQNQWDGFNVEIESIDKKISVAERQEDLNKSIAANISAAKSTQEPKELKNYSFQDAMKQSVSGKLSGLVKEMDQEARHAHPNQMFRGVAIPSSILEQRAINSSDVNATEVMSFVDQLEANLVLASAGANFYSGVADQKFPIVSGITSSWASDYSGADVAATGSTSNLTLSPKKLISVVDMSAESLTQNAGLEAAIRRNMAGSVAATLEAALLGIADVTDAPTSIFLDATAGATTAPATANYTEAEATVLGNDIPLQGGRFAYLMDKNTYSSVKALAQIASVSPLYTMEDKMLNGYFSLFSTNVGNGGGATKAHCLFGDFSRVHVCQFGGIDILFDPYTKSRQGVGSLVVTSLVDGAATNGATAFVQLTEA
tara:strand:+ start:1896 stop:3110 length:1215 start_codon:yes stop_codon:yes gene_type:complete